MSNSPLIIRPSRGLHGETTVPGDKSISHRALLLGALAQGVNRVHGWLAAGDTLATLRAMQALGIQVERGEDTLAFAGSQLLPPADPVNCANSGTAIRLLAGLLAGKQIAAVLDGSDQLRRRPMRRVADPLRLMGASISDTDGYAPLTIHPVERLRGIEYAMPVASAQVKSALILAGLDADGETRIIEAGHSRDHTERMLQAMGATIGRHDGTITVSPQRDPLRPLDLTIPGDFSSAAFLIVAAAITRGSQVTLRGVGLNPTRTGLLDILRRMGATIHVEEGDTQGGEPVGTLHVASGDLQAAVIEGDEVVRAIDELPVLAVTATQAAGETMIRDAAELRVKEVDRIALLAGELRKLGAAIEELPDGMIVRGPARLRGAQVSSHGDHRLGMALAVAGLVAQGETYILDAGCIGDSFPGFAATLARLGAEVD